MHGIHVQVQASCTLYKSAVDVRILVVQSTATTAATPNRVPLNAPEDTELPDFLTTI